MASFTALNIEPAEDVQEEVDDTKEIQIEEALKLYQNALKLHSQGPAFYLQAKDAYTALLQSEIFKYPDAISDFHRDTEGGDIEDAVGEIDANDAAASALPQTIFLSYKNHGQFLLDVLKETLQKQPAIGVDERRLTVAKDSRSAVAMFAEALERDDTDLDLWRKSARIGATLNSYRLARYCLESVLVGDDNEVEVRAEQLGLDEAFAAEDLRKVLQVLKDELSSIQAPPLKKPRQSLFRFFKNHSQDPYPYLPALSPEIPKTITFTSNRPPSPHIIKSFDRTWNGVGKAILQLLAGSRKDPGLLIPGAVVGISIPSREVSPQSPGHGSLSVAANAQPTEHKSEAPETQNPTELVDDQSSIDQRAESQLRESLEGLSKQATENPATAGNMEVDTESKTPSANPRKRSSASMGNDETADSMRTKSRRIRARESNAESLLQTEDASQEKNFEDRLEKFSHADNWLFGTVGDLLSKAGVEALGTINDLKKHLSPSTDSGCSQSKNVEAVLVHDLQGALRNWDDEKARSATQGDSSTALQDSRGRKRSGLAIFFEHSRKPKQKTSKKKPLFEDSGLDAFAEEINESGLHLHEVAFQWLGSLLKPGKSQTYTLTTDEPSTESPYVCLPWPENLKETVVQLIIQEDPYIHEKLTDAVSQRGHEILDQVTSGSLLSSCTDEYYAQVEMIQAIHELHLDIHAHMNNPNSEIDQDTRDLQRDRLTRWGMLAQTAINSLLDMGADGEQLDRISLRHLWSMTFHSNMAEGIDRDHVLLCLQALKQALVSFGNPEIALTNNAIMPEISVAALDQEISRLNSMGFFMRIFGSVGEEPVSLIESIEPVLDPSSVEYVPDSMSDDTTPSVPAHFQELASFLDRGDASLRLFLWRRLQDAYRAIDYLPKVVSCQLRSIEAIVKEIRGEIYLGSQDDRPSILLRWLKSVSNILTKLVPQLIDDPIKSFECIDVGHLRSSMTAVAYLSRLLHSFALYEDAVKVGQRPPLELRGSLGKSLENFKDKLRDMQVRCWVLQYTLVKEYMSQEKETFPDASDEQIHFLRAVHNALGVRSTCKYADKILLKLMKSELLSIETQEDCEFDIAQVLFDLHGFKFSNQLGLFDHGCPTEKPNPQSAAMMIDFVLMQVNRLNIKDLSRSDLKTTIEKVQQAIGPTKHSLFSFNKRILSGYLKSPINPSEMLRLVQGLGGLALRSVPVPNAAYAKKGWYFLLGHAALTKFRSQKRLNPGPTNDLDDAIGYFRQDLEYATERWETWYRLAQCYDSKLDEEIMWSAEKINNGKAELTNIQRTAIHCYAMAVAGALRAGDDDLKSRATISELFTDFGIRLYASSREPLNMAAFSVEDIERHFSDFDSQKVYTGKPFKEMRIYAVWSLAGYMFKRAMVDKPNYWVNHYMLSKCCWKMFNSDDVTRGSGKEVTIDDVLDTLLDAIETLPQRKEKGSSESIFEPHFKLVSVLHKLVLRRLIEPSKAGEILSETPWGKKLSAPQNLDDWKPYVLDVLKRLKNADKQNWHHRILVRLAKVHCDGQEDDATAAATAAKNELMPQIFTKTMNINVWRPEFERPGRHFVYTTRYASLFTKLLDQTSDRSNLEQLLRKVRKKQGDFINHTKLWEDMCIVYAKLIRRAGNIPEHLEDGIVKVLSWDEFVANTARLDGFKDLAGPTMDLLREAVEFKKLNNNLMKVTMFEDLTADIYARLYDENKHRFIEQANEENKGRMKVDHLMNIDGAADAPTPPTSAPASETPVPRGRTKGISRRDIQKRAEALASRHARPVAAKATTAPAEEEKIPAAPLVRVPTLSSLRGIATENRPAAQDSVPNSLHESADDESELSEIDDERLAKLKAEQSLMFPNLKSSKSPEPVSEVVSVAEEDGDPDGEMAVGDENNEDERGDDMGETDLADEGGGDTEMQTVAEDDEQVDDVGEDVANEEDVEMGVEDKDETEGGDAEGDGDLNTEEIGDEATTFTAEDGDENDHDEDGTANSRDKEDEEEDKEENEEEGEGEGEEEANADTEAANEATQDEQETTLVDEDEPLSV